MQHLAQSAPPRPMRPYALAGLSLLVATVSVLGSWAEVSRIGDQHVTVTGASRGGWIVWLVVAAGCVAAVRGNRVLAQTFAFAAATVAAAIGYGQGDTLLSKLGGMSVDAGWGALTVFLAPALLVVAVPRNDAA